MRLYFFSVKLWINVIKLSLLLLAVTIIFFSPEIAKIFYPLKYWDIICLQAQENNIDPYLIAAIIKTESNFNPLAVSPKGAKGLMQIMPQTGESVAKEIGNKDFTSGQLFIPEVNILLGAHYVADLFFEFQNNSILALASYNGGIGNVRKWLSEKGCTHFDSIDQIPFPETRYFVQRVVWNHKVYKYLYRQKNITG